MPAMEAWLRLQTPEESPQVLDLRARTADVLETLATTAERAGAVHLVGLPALVLQLRRIAPAATRSSIVMQPQYAYDPEDPGVSLTRAARARGVDTTLMTSLASVRNHPLLPSIFPTTLVGPVFLRALVIDGRQAIIGGPDSPSGERTSWYTTIPVVIEAVLEIWEATVPLCEPILPPGGEPPLNDRQLDVARLLCVGEDDSSIAHLLGLPTRTVERDVQVVLQEVGARTRTEAVLNMRGRGVNGGWRNAYA
jgi:DNA-binding CsgD family transcriptional regulator